MRPSHISILILLSLSSSCDATALSNWINSDDGPWDQFQLWMSSVIFGWRGKALSKDETFTDTGAEVFAITFSDQDLAHHADPSVLLDSLNITKVTQLNGINGNSKNRYVWSMALDDDDGLYVGTLNQLHDPANLTSLIWSVMTAPRLQQFDAMVDTLLRQWSGLPISENEGAEIYYKAADSQEFQQKLQTSSQIVGFRKMVNYDGDIYAGSANGPDGPFDGASYDFDTLYSQGSGAKIYTNAGGNGTFQMLDDLGTLDSRDKTIRGMVVSSYSNRLFMGTEASKCAKVVIYDKSTGVWKKIEMDGDLCTHSVSQLYDLGDGKILFGVWKTLGYGVFMLDETDGDSLTELNTPQWWYHLSCGVMEIRVFNDQLYVGVLSFVRGFALIRTQKVNDLLNLDDGDWELITGSGFGVQQREHFGERQQGNDYTWSSADVNGIYFIGTFAGSSRDDRAQLWASTDGADWRIVESEVFDASRFMYGFRTMEVTSDQKTIYIGSAVNLYLPDE
ncbi:expressed unknown protein [Seminavis robusta]|uniref:Uncharacterized protein n=1 Tax=Seminavis robusta TaxID=568900 RepID=A0A9N8EAU1_9STRA|nr:expressed unknown protein [Seminavis robusta]|eukprot:Sro898_g217660.1 n/a (506) ;mRNA; r:33807-35463